MLFQKYRYLKKIVILFFLLLLNFTFSGSCALLQKLSSMVPTPSATLSDLQFTGLDMKRIYLQIAIDVKNPYPVDIPKAAFDIALNLEGTQLLKLKSLEAKGIGSSQTKTLKFNTSIPFTNINKIYQKLTQDKSKFLMALKGNMDLQIPVEKLPEFIKKPLEQSQNKNTSSRKLANSYRFDIDLEKNIPVIIPEIEISNFQFQRPELSSGTNNNVSSYLDRLLKIGRSKSPGSALRNGLKDVDINLKVSFDLNLKNKAKAVMDLGVLDYTLFLNNKKILNGLSEDAKTSQGKSTMRVNTSFPLKSITTSLASLISNGRGAIRVKGKTNLNIEGWSQGSPMQFNLDKTNNLSW